MNIPETIEAATEQLEGLGALLQASEWERAAIVYAFTHVSELGGNQHSEGHNNKTLSMNEFAAKGIVGLKTDVTVRKYHLAWQDAIDQNNAAMVTPGTSYILPIIDWPPEGRSARLSGASPKRAAQAIHEDKEYTKELIEQIPTEDLFHLINTAQAKVDAAKTPRSVKEDGPLDVLVASADMADALDKLEGAEAPWTSAVREGHISDDVAIEDLRRLDIVHTLMHEAHMAESFEMGVPRA